MCAAVGKHLRALALLLHNFAVCCKLAMLGRWSAKLKSFATIFDGHQSDNL